MSAPSNRTTEARIHRIENNLMPGLQIARELVPQLICGEQPAIDPRPFSPDRFR